VTHSAKICKGEELYLQTALLVLTIFMKWHPSRTVVTVPLYLTLNMLGFISASFKTKHEVGMNDQ